MGQAPHTVTPEQAGQTLAAVLRALRPGESWARVKALATGRGVVYCVLEAMAELKIRPEEATAVVQGFGNVGSVVCQELYQRGVKIIAIGDRYGSIRNPKGIDVPALLKHMAIGYRLTEFPLAEPMPSEELLTTPCTILAPCALERVITAENAPRLKCRILAEGANGPTTLEADRILTQSDTFVIPDILCNAGGVTVSYFEWVQDMQSFFWTEDRINDSLKGIMDRAFGSVHEMATRYEVDMRTAAYMVAVARVAEATTLRGLYP